MTAIGNEILKVAKTYEGTFEWAGKDNNPKVIAMYAKAGHPEVKQDSVPWCAAFVGSVLAELGIQNTGSLSAKSYLSWGEKIALKDAQPGDIVVFHRGDPKGWQGHVAFYLSQKDGRVSVLGGNQKDQVNVSTYLSSSVAGVRRPVQPRTKVSQSTTIRATTIGAAGTVVTTSAAAVGSLGETAQIVAVVAGFITLGAFAWIFRERIKKWAEGVR